jgi:hypothetical protein
VAAAGHAGTDDCDGELFRHFSTLRDVNEIVDVTYVLTSGARRRRRPGTQRRSDSSRFKLLTTSLVSVLCIESLGRASVASAMADS